MPAPRLILASASPRRAQLLDEAGYAFTVEPAHVDETRLAEGVDPRDLARTLATHKRDAVAKRHAGEPVVVLAADTIARAMTGEVLGKPRDREDARRILRLMIGTRHGVLTGWAATRCDTGQQLAGQVRSDVTFRDVSDDELDTFLDTGLWKGKAGAYGIQDMPGGSDPFVLQIDGELSNIVGLPMPQVVEAFDELGVGRLGA